MKTKMFMKVWNQNPESEVKLHFHSVLLSAELNVIMQRETKKSPVDQLRINVFANSTGLISFLSL